MTAFLVICFIVILIFSKPIAIVTIFFLTFGDLFAKAFGIIFGKHKIFQSKSLEGSLSYFAICLLFGFLLTFFLEISLPVIVIGALVATITELVSVGIDDNFSVGLVSAIAMWAAEKFL